MLSGEGTAASSLAGSLAVPRVPVPTAAEAVVGAPVNGDDVGNNRRRAGGVRGLKLCGEGLGDPPGDGGVFTGDCGANAPDAGVP